MRQEEWNELARQAAEAESTSSTSLIERVAAAARAMVRGAIPRRARNELRRLRDLDRNARRVYLRLRLERLLGRSQWPALTRIAGAHSVLFVCHGNIMRSALAAALLERHLATNEGRRVRVRSAGMHAIPGSPADPRMSRAAEDMGLSLDTHRATLISRALIAESDLIIGMDYSNEAELLARFPEAAPKILLLGCVDPVEGRGAVIADPFGGNDQTATECATRIVACVDVLMKRLGT